MKIKVKSALGVPLTRIAQEFKMDRKTARKLRAADGEPKGINVPPRPSKLDQHGSWIQERIDAGVPAAQIARDLARHGITMPYPTVRDYVRKRRPEKPKRVEEVRFETPMAKQSQCDWTDMWLQFDSGRELVHAFVMVLGYSRYTFGMFSPNMDEIALQRCHTEAFLSFGGVPWQILYDNMKTVTIGRDDEGKPIVQTDFADFAGRYGFEIKVAAPYRAKTKGKVERMNGFIKTSFLPGRTFGDMADAQRQFTEWIAEINLRRHRTHGEIVAERFAREQPLLLPLRAGMPAITRAARRVVTAEGMIEYETNRYEIPRGHRGQTVLVRDDGGMLRIYFGDELLCEHTISRGRRKVVPLQKRESKPPILDIAIEQRSLAEYDEAIR
jgi:transposase